MSAGGSATTAKQRATIALGLMRQGSRGRALDDCFEMGDGDDVARELQKRARRNANTAALVNRYLAPQWRVEVRS